MRTRSSAAVIVFLSAILSLQTQKIGFADETRVAPYVPGEVLLKFRSQVSSAEKIELRSETGATHLRTFRSGLQHWRLPASSSVERTIIDFKYDSRIEYIEPNHIGEFQLDPNDTYYPDQWAPPLMDAPDAWDVTTGDPNVIVAVIDTGTAFTHQDLVGRIWFNDDPVGGGDDDENGFTDDQLGWDFANNDNNPYPAVNVHGTRVAGIIAAALNDVGVVGIAPDVRLMIILAGDNTITEANAIAAFEYAVGEGAKIINASFRFLGCGTETPCHKSLEEVIGDAWQKEVLFVAPAGNEGKDIDDTNYPCYPANFDLPNIISVAATDPNDDLASFYPAEGSSSYGATSVDLGAPGKSIYTTDWESTELPVDQMYYFDDFSGTSAAVPHVAGVAALVYSRNPDMPAEIAKARILENVDAVSSLVGITVTEGRLNAYAPLLNFDSNAPATISNLAGTGSGNGSFSIQWVSTGDDGTDGSAVLYEVRTSTSSISSGNWLMATRALNEPIPDPNSGVTESMTVSNLSGGTVYYVAFIG